MRYTCWPWRGEDVFDTKFGVGGPINSKTGAPFGANTKAFADWAASHNKQVLKDGQIDRVSGDRQKGCFLVSRSPGQRQHVHRTALVYDKGMFAVGSQCRVAD